MVEFLVGFFSGIAFYVAVDVFGRLEEKAGATNRARLERYPAFRARTRAASLPPRRPRPSGVSSAAGRPMAGPTADRAGRISKPRNSLEPHRTF